MKKLLLLALITFSTLFSACLFEDDEDEWDAAKVCPEAGTNAYGMPNRGTFVDERDGRVYKYTTIGDQVWMAENLKFELPYPYSLCYGMETCKERKWWSTDDKIVCSRDTTHLAEIAQRMQSTCTDNDCIATEWCEKVGRYYSLYENGSEAGLLNLPLIDTICPVGWHVPSKEEWAVMMKSVDYDYVSILSSDSALAKGNYDYGNDVCGFTAFLPGSVGGGKIERLFDLVEFWSSTSENLLYVTSFRLPSGGLTDPIQSRFHVRCVKDD